MRFSRFLTGALLFLVAATAMAQRLYEYESPRLGVAASPSITGPDEELGPATVPVRIDFDLLRSAPDLLAFPMPEASDDETLWVVRTHFEDRGEGNVLWRGRVADGPLFDSVVLSLQDGHLIGMFGELGGLPLSLQATPDGRGRVIRSTAAGPSSPVVHDSLSPPVSLTPPVGDGPVSVASPAMASADTDRSNAYEVTVLVLYTEYATWTFTTTPKAYVQGTIDYVNTVFANNNLNLTLRIVHTARMPEAVAKSAGAGAGDEWLDAIKQDRTVTSLRVRHRADVVVSFLSEKGVRNCGLAWAWTNSTNTAKTMAHWAFVIVNLFPQGCSNDHAGASTTVAHELGHVFGAQHQHGAPGITPTVLYPYGFAHADKTRNPPLLTAVATGPHPKKLVPFYSTARVAPNGWVLGMAGQAENEEVLLRTRAAVASYSDYLTKPAKPTNLTGAPSVIHGSVLLRWRDNADNETHYVVKYRRAGKQWKKAPEDMYPSKVPNVEKANIHGLEPGKLYTFRVTAVNDFGSASSNKIRLRTGGPK